MPEQRKPAPAERRHTLSRRHGDLRILTEEEPYRRLHESLFDAYGMVDLSGRLIDFNQVFVAMLGYSPDELRDLTYADLTPAKWHAIEADILTDEVMVSGYSRVYQKEYVRKDGTVFPVELRTFLLRDEGGRPEAMWAIVRDITERERQVEQLAAALAEAEAASRSKSRFLAAASHDLRQPLQALDLFQNALSATALTPEQQRISEQMHLSVRHLNAILTTLLDFSRLEAGGIQPQFQKVALDKLLGPVARGYAAQASLRKISLGLRLPHRLPLVWSDPKLLHSLLDNLLGNALKYAPDGSILLGVRRRRDHLLLQVWDTGIGIAPEHLESIFEEYFQVGNPERSESKGLGLGLAIARRIARLLGAELSCRSRLGRGSVFTCRLPLAL